MYDGRVTGYMNWEFLARYGGLYTLLGGGGTVAVAYVLPSPYHAYGLLGVIAVGALLIGKAAVDSGGGPTTGGDVVGSAAGLEARGDETFAARDSRPANAGQLFYAVGLVAFGLAALVSIL